MFKPVSFFIGWRYVRAANAERVITLYALISIIGLTLGVAVLIVVLSVLNGFEREFKDRILGLVAPIKIYSSVDWADWRTEIEALSQDSRWAGSIKSYAPFIELPGMLVKGGATETVYLAAIDPELEKRVSPIARYLTDRYDISELFAGQPNGLVVGQAIAAKLGVNVGDSIKLLVALPVNRDAGVAPRALPKSIVLPIVEIISTKTELDQQLALIHINFAQELLEMSGVMGVKLSLHEVMSANELAGQIRYGWNPARSGYHFSIVDWTQTHGNLYHAIKLPQTVMWLLLFFVLIVAAFNMTTTLFMMVRQKRKELAVLQTLGATTRQIASCFLAQGSLVAATGILAGVVLGVTIAHLLPLFVNLVERMSGEVLFQGDSYFIQFLPIEVLTTDIVYVSIAATLISFLAVLLPALQASRLDPVQALRGEGD